jgi:hypothetical protein
MTGWNAPTPEGFVKTLQEQTLKKVQRFARDMDLVLRPKEPRVGQTPKERIYKRSKSVL